MSVVTQLLTLLAQIVGGLSDASAITSVITTLENIIAAGIQEIQTVAPMIKNIITALQNNGSITADQMTQLEALDAATDQAFEAAATAAGLPAATS
jgi:hypothetical protein